MISFEIYKNFFAGYNLISGWVVNKNELAFSLIKEYDEEAMKEMERRDYVDPAERKLVYFNLEQLDKSFEMPIKGWRDICGGAAIYPKNQSIAVHSIYQSADHVYIQDMQTNIRTHDLIGFKANGTHGGVSRCKTINGRLYGCSVARTVLRWEGEGRWSCISDELIQKTLGLPGTTEYGFDAIDGFAEDDIYAVGGNGDAWHYDGNLWAQFFLPADMPYESLIGVTCGGGKV